jgi:threonyl-tRNA synthetase
MKNNNKQENNLEVMRHSCEHVLHMAMVELYPGLKRAMGPATKEGFYHDFDYEGKISELEFPKIEKRMREIIKKDLPIIKNEISIKEARELFKDNQYKQEWLDQIEKKGEKPTIYWTGKPYSQGSDVDLCKGPHLESTGKVGYFKLLSVAGAYWHGDESNKMLTRIYGTCFPSQEELDRYLTQVTEAKKRDHRKIGKDLNYFVFSDLVGKGLPLWTPEGSVIRRELERFIVDEEIKRGYEHVYTPDLAKLELYKASGHYPYYKESMYSPIEIEDEEFMLRPMTCPHHFELYKSKQRSYRELPIRYAELAKLYRFEKSGELTGLMRVRSFCLADAHIIAKLDQASGEINKALDLIEDVAEILGLKPGEDYSYRLSLGNRKDLKKYFNDDQSWDLAESVLKGVLTNRSAPYSEAKNEAAFYGPKIDIQIKNVLGKEDTAFTVQYDFVMPKRFNLKYINEKGKEEEPIVIHRSSIGAIERTIAFLIEKHAGAMPIWLSPIQVVVLPINDQFADFSSLIKRKFEEEGIRVKVDAENKTLQAKIRDYTLQKVPYLCIIGKKEVSKSSKTEIYLSVRTREGLDLGSLLLDKFIKSIKENIEKKKI